MNKSTILYILIVQFVFLTSCVGQDDAKKIKSMVSAEYSPKRSGVMDRTDALDKEKSTFQEFNENDQIIRYDQFDSSDGSIYRSHRFLDYEGKVAQRIERYDGDNNLVEYEVRKLNTQNEIDKIRRYNHSDEIVGVEEYRYDDVGQLSARKDSSLKYNRTLKWEYEYDVNGEISVRRAYDKDGKLRDTRTYKYDSEGNEIESDLTRANGDFTLFKSTYNEFGDIMENGWYDKEGVQTNLTKFEYVYDDYGKWVTKRRISNDELNYVWERTIKYRK